MIGTESVEGNVDKFMKAANICRYYCQFDKVKLLSPFNLQDKDWVKIKPLRSREDYSRFIIKQIHKYVDTKYLLMFQNDGWILNPDAWSDDFYQYDYIGAAWQWDEYPSGNGGFTFRTQKFMKECSRVIMNQFEPEDLVICTKYRPHLISKGFKFAPRKIAERFSLEKNYKYRDKWDNQFGFHDLNKTDISDWKPPQKEFALDWDQWSAQLKGRNMQFQPYPPTIEACIGGRQPDNRFAQFHLELSKAERRRL